jgi:predicted nucleotidyltransferase
MLKSTQINIPSDRIEEFCQRWKINELALFGSILRDDFTSESDIDVLVSFAGGAGWSLFDLLDMTEELETIFGRKVDLVEKEALRNPFRRYAILPHREIIYAAR